MLSSNVDICSLGVDQEKVNMLAIEYCDKIKHKLWGNTLPVYDQYSSFYKGSYLNKIKNHPTKTNKDSGKTGIPLPKS